MTLAELKMGQSARVTRVDAQSPVTHRLMEMGLVAGAEVRMVRKAPLGDPVELSVRGYRLAIRRREAAHFEVESEA